MEELLKKYFPEKFSKEKVLEIENFPLMKTPIPLITITLFYLLFVYKFGPKLMANRSAFKLNKILVIYNAIQVISNLYLLYYGLIECRFYRHIFAFGSWNVNDEEPRRIYKLYIAMWMGFILKIVDLLDTVFFVLRKRQNQVSFLHVYHHSSVTWVVWIIVKYHINMGEMLGIIAYNNGIVHAIMYSYYLLAALGPRYQRYLWWKRYLTQIQLVQFFYNIFYITISFALNRGGRNKGNMFFFGYMMTFVILFANFYRKTYLKKRADNERVKNDLNFNLELKKDE